MIQTNALFQFQEKLFFKNVRKEKCARKEWQWLTDCRKWLTEDAHRTVRVASLSGQMSSKSTVVIMSTIVMVVKRDWALPSLYHSRSYLSSSLATWFTRSYNNCDLTWPYYYSKLSTCARFHEAELTCGLIDVELRVNSGLRKIAFHELFVSFLLDPISYFI